MTTKIGVTANIFHPNPLRHQYGPKRLLYIESELASSIANYRALPILIPNLKDSQLPHFLDDLDGLLLSGGADVAPSTYGEKTLNKIKWNGDPYRDEYELKIIQYFCNLKKPILGIGRGAQILNCHYGGTLFQDIHRQRPGSQEHRDLKRFDQWSHSIQFEEGGYLAGLYGDREQLEVTSIHHQAIANLGGELKLEATSPEDGVIEAFSGPQLANHWVLGVQWHPEFTPKESPNLISPNPIFEEFTSACRGV